MGSNLKPPYLGFCGFSGSGKTTLLEKLTKNLIEKGLKVGYLKHDAHKFSIDKEGKDTQRLFDSGVRSLLITSESESAARFNDGGAAGSQGAVFALCDIVLVEGYKSAPWEKLWVHPHSGCRDETPDIDNLIGSIGGGGELIHDALDSIAKFVMEWLEKKVATSPLYGGLLIGGKSVRMGKPKSLMPVGDSTYAQKQYDLLKNICEHVYLLGSGILPDTLVDADRIADPPGIKGPLAGLISARRFAPEADWFVLAVDLPNVNAEFMEKLKSKRKAGYRAVLARNPDSNRAEPLCALYSSQLLSELESSWNGELSILRVLAKIGISGDPSLYDEKILKNVNRPEDISK